MIVRSLAVFLLALSASAGVFARGPDCDTIVTTNMTPKWAWITVYDFTQGFNLDSGWMAPFGSRTWKSGLYSCTGIYNVRVEVKSSESTNQPGTEPGTLSDMRIEVRHNDHSVYLKAPIRVQLTDAPPSRWRYDSTFSLELDDSMAPAASTSTLPKVVFHNKSPFKAEFVVYHKPLKITECMANGVSSAVVGYDGNPGYSVQACGTKFKFIANRSTSPLPQGTSDLYFRVSLEAGTPMVSPTTLLRFTNHTAASVEYAVTTTSGSGGAKKSVGTKCLVPGGFDVLPVPPGTLMVATNLLPSCGSPDRLALAPHELTAIAGTSRDLGVLASLDTLP